MIFKKRASIEKPPTRISACERAYSSRVILLELTVYSLRKVLWGNIWPIFFSRNIWPIFWIFFGFFFGNYTSKVWFLILLKRTVPKSSRYMRPRPFFTDTFMALGIVKLLILTVLWTFVFFRKASSQIW